VNRRQMSSFYPLTLAVRRLFHKLGYGLAALHRDEDISIGMRAVLESVIDGGPQTVPQMARVRPVSRQHIQGLVNALLEGGYVEYVDNPAHKRSKLVSPTEHGEQAFQAIRQKENEAFRFLTLQVAPDDLEAATKVLQHLIVAFESKQWRSIVDRYNPETEP